MGVAWEDQVGLAGHRRSGREGLHRSDLVDLDRMGQDRVAWVLVGIRQAGQEEHRACAPRDRTFLRKDLMAHKVRAVAKDRAARIRVVVSVGRESKGVLEVGDVAASADRAARAGPADLAARPRAFAWATGRPVRVVQRVRRDRRASPAPMARPARCARWGSTNAVEGPVTRGLRPENRTARAAQNSRDTCNRIRFDCCANTGQSSVATHRLPPSQDRSRRVRKNKIKIQIER